MPKPFEKTDPYIGVGNDLSLFDPPMYDPQPNTNDIDSGMQRATNNGVIGLATENIGVNASGAIIGGAVATNLHISIG